MNAIAPLHWSLVSPRCGLMQSAMLPYVAWGQNCWMSPLHSEKTHAAFDSLDEQPTESSLMCACYAGTNVSLAGRDARAHGLEIDVCNLGPPLEPTPSMP